eukprot:TRINITY_DN9594_c3_g1_i2.p1 TRINITY_DN9594_c3_g1~~TRINITY_DN9594_c3_g1_i2.p1  ORF type:complete len:819 (+),score=236.87 TRINITY_DN9594_c3_g1_i2:85-2541(+)
MSEGKGGKGGKPGKAKGKGKGTPATPSLAPAGGKKGGKGKAGAARPPKPPTPPASRLELAAVPPLSLDGGAGAGPATPPRSDLQQKLQQLNQEVVGLQGELMHLRRSSSPKQVSVSGADPLYQLFEDRLRSVFLRASRDGGALTREALVSALRADSDVQWARQQDGASTATGGTGDASHADHADASRFELVFRQLEAGSGAVTWAEVADCARGSWDRTECGAPPPPHSVIRSESAAGSHARGTPQTESDRRARAVFSAAAFHEPAEEVTRGRLVAVLRSHADSAQIERLCHFLDEEPDAVVSWEEFRALLPADGLRTVPAEAGADVSWWASSGGQADSAAESDPAPEPAPRPEPAPKRASPADQPPLLPAVQSAFRAAGGGAGGPVRRQDLLKHLSTLSNPAVSVLRDVLMFDPRPVLEWEEVQALTGVRQAAARSPSQRAASVRSPPSPGGGDGSLSALLSVIDRPFVAQHERQQMARQQSDRNRQHRDLSPQPSARTILGAMQTDAVTPPQRGIEHLVTSTPPARMLSREDTITPPKGAGPTPRSASSNPLRSPSAVPLPASPSDRDTRRQLRIGAVSERVASIERLATTTALGRGARRETLSARIRQAEERLLALEARTKRATETADMRDVSGQCEGGMQGVAQNARSFFSELNRVRDMVPQRGPARDVAGSSAPRVFQHLLQCSQALRAELAAGRDSEAHRRRFAAMDGIVAALRSRSDDLGEAVRHHGLQEEELVHGIKAQLGALTTRIDEERLRRQQMEATFVSLMESIIVRVFQRIDKSFAERKAMEARLTQRVSAAVQRLHQAAGTVPVL